MNEIYVYPETAKQKLKMAQEMNKTVYIYGVAGCGKTAFLQHFLSRKPYVYLDAATDTVDKFQNCDEDNILIVVDNIQAAEPEEIRRAILGFTENKSVWLILVGRCRCPGWLVAASVRQYPFIVIDEEDLKLGERGVRKLLREYEIEMDEESIQKLAKESQGNALVLKLAIMLILRNGKDDRCKLYVYDSSVMERTQQMLWDYVEREVYSQWNPALLEFVQEMSIVDSFDVRMAETVSGRRNVEGIIQKAWDTGNFLKENNGEYVMIQPVRKSMRRRLKMNYSKEQLNDLYYRAGICYIQEGRTLEALAMFEACGDEMQISRVLIENARINPGNGFLFELRKYYLELPESTIEDSVELIAGMCMLQSLLLNPQESERWYKILEQKEKKAIGRAKVEIKSWRAYLDIGLPHRGSADIIALVKSVGTMMMNREIILPELSVTNNSPSMMNGGKDFCEWSKRDKELASGIGKALSFVLGKFGAGLVELALAESMFEKGGDNYEVVRLISKGQIQAENQGKLELEYVAVGLLTNVHLLSGHAEDARLLLSEFAQKAERKKADKILLNIRNFLCRISLYQGEKAEIEAWMKEAPGDLEDFNPLERSRYLTKIRVYIMYGKYEMAEMLLGKMIYYAEVMHRTYIQMECQLLFSIIQYRRGRQEWKDSFLEVLSKLEEYHFVRLIAREGAAVLPLLQSSKWHCQDKDFLKQVTKEVSSTAAFYPSYLKGQEYIEESFSENALCILRMQAEGLSNEQIAEKMKISVATVKYHCKQNYKKLGVGGKAAAVMEAKRRKII